MASHAIKSGKRYRYYVSARLISGSRSEAPDGMRVPSAEVENGVIEIKLAGAVVRVVSGVDGELLTAVLRAVRCSSGAA